MINAPPSETKRILVGASHCRRRGSVMSTTTCITNNRLVRRGLVIFFCSRLERGCLSEIRVDKYSVTKNHRKFQARWSLMTWVTKTSGIRALRNLFAVFVSLLRVDDCDLPSFCWVHTYVHRKRGVSVPTNSVKVCLMASSSAASLLKSESREC